MSVIIKGRDILPSNKKLRVGLFGGSFDPAHVGHSYVAQKSLDLLNLDYIVCMVVPLSVAKKSCQSTCEQRMHTLQSFIEDERVIISNYEQDQEDYNSSTTIKRLVEQYPEIDFFWIMGYDNMLSIHTWHMWETIFENTTVVVAKRNSSLKDAENSIAAKKFNIITLEEGAASSRKSCWLYMDVDTPQISSTIIRNSMEKTDITKVIKETVETILDLEKAKDVVYVPTPNSTLASAVFVVTCLSKRHIDSVAEKLIKALRTYNFNRSAINGRGSGDWVVLDLQHIIVHLFIEEKRQEMQMDEIIEWQGR